MTWADGCSHWECIPCQQAGWDGPPFEGGYDLWNGERLVCELNVLRKHRPILANAGWSRAVGKRAAALCMSQQPCGPSAVNMTELTQKDFR